MDKTNIYQIPFSYSKRNKNMKGPYISECLVSSRYLKFTDAGKGPGDQSMINIDIMTFGSDDNPKKLTSLIMSYNELLSAVEKIQKDAHGKK